MKNCFIYKENTFKTFIDKLSGTITFFTAIALVFLLVGCISDPSYYTGGIWRLCISFIIFGIILSVFSFISFLNHGITDIGRIDPNEKYYYPYTGKYKKSRNIKRGDNIIVKEGQLSPADIEILEVENPSASPSYNNVLDIIQYFDKPGGYKGVQEAQIDNHSILYAGSKANTTVRGKVLQIGDHRLAMEIFEKILFLHN